MSTEYAGMFYVILEMIPTFGLAKFFTPVLDVATTYLMPLWTSYDLDCELECVLGLIPTFWLSLLIYAFVHCFIDSMKYIPRIITRNDPP